jgi:hypothetical protein
MSQAKQNQVTDTETVDLNWKSLYKAGGVAALIIAVLLLCEIIVFSVWPQPTTVIGYFKLFNDNWFIGLLDLDLLGMIAYVLFIPVILALYMALKRVGESLLLIATALFFVGITVFFSTNTAFPMLSLSDQYATAATDAQRSMFLAAGQAMLTTFNITTFQESYIIVSTSWLMISVVMLRGIIFSKTTAYSGIMAGATGIGAVMLEHMPVIGDLFALIVAVYFAAIVFLAMWVILTGRRLYQLGTENNT